MAFSTLFCVLRMFKVLKIGLMMRLSSHQGDTAVSGSGHFLKGRRLHTVYSDKIESLEFLSKTIVLQSTNVCL